MIASGLRRLLGVLFFILGTAALGLADQQIRADWMETLLDQAQTLRRYRGGVAYVDSIRGIQVSADSMSVRVQDAWYAFMSQVVYRDSIRQMRANALEFREKQDLAIFQGSVSYQDSARRLTASRVTYQQADQYLVAEGEVRLDLLREDAALTATQMRYDIASRTIWAAPSARIALVTGKHDTLLMQADSMVVQWAPLIIEMHGAAELRSGYAVAEASSAFFNDSTLVLQGHPLSEWHRPSTEDALSMKASRMDFGLRDRQIHRVTLADSVVIHSIVMQEGHPATHQIEADSACVEVLADTVRGISSYGHSQLSMRDGSGNRAELAGRELMLSFVRGDLDSLVLVGDGVGVFSPQDSASVSRITGQEYVIWFDESRIERMCVSGQGICDHMPKDEGRVHLSGDLLRFVFEEGHPRQIDVEGGVQGTYLESSEVRPP